MSIISTPPYPSYFDASGAPLTGGYLYFGTANQNPETNPITVYWDAAYTQPAAQPIRTSGGFAVRNGSPANVFVNSDYSMTVRDKNKNIIYSKLLSDWQQNPSLNASSVPFTAYGTGAVTRSSREKMSESVSVLDFGADKTGASDCASSFAAAVAALPTSGGTLIIPDGSYTYSGGLTCTYPISIVMSNNAVLNYTGNGYAIQLGRIGNSIATADYGRFSVSGGNFIGGASMIHGIYISNYTLYPIVEEVKFNNFGNSTGWAIFAQGQNWLVTVAHCTHVSSGARNFCITNGYDLSISSPDFGSSQLLAYGNNVLSGNQGGVGIFTQGAGSMIFGNKIEGRSPNIGIGSYANSTKILSNYFESLPSTVLGSGNCIQYGETTGASSTRALTVKDNYCNLHQSDFGNTGSFIGPATALSQLLHSTVKDNSFAETTGTIPVVTMNNIVNQNGNSGINNLDAGGTAPPLRTIASNVQAWKGEGAQTLTLSAGVSTETGGATPRTAKASIDLSGKVTLQGYVFATSTTIPAGTSLFTVPPGYIPARQCVCTAIDGGTGTAYALTISIFGVVVSSGALTAGSLLFLDGVAYSIF